MNWVRRNLHGAKQRLEGDVRLVLNLGIQVPMPSSYVILEQQRAAAWVREAPSRLQLVLGVGDHFVDIGPCLVFQAALEFLFVPVPLPALILVSDYRERGIRTMIRRTDC